MRTTLSILAMTIAALASLPALAAELLMFEEPGCIWCPRWHAEVGPGYGQTEEGRIAPLRRLDVRDPVPAEFRLDQRVTMTPTFVLVDGGKERGRLLGYPGAHFFYPMLVDLLKRLPPARDEAQRDAGNREAPAAR